MAATLVDEREEEGPDTTEEVQETEQPEVKSEESEIDDDLPDKYRGKSMKELVQMHQEAEKLAGRQGNEVGELRNIVDTFIQSQLVKEAPQEEPEDEEIDWYADPKKAVDRAVSSHPSIKQAEEVVTQTRKQNSMQYLQQKHPDMKEILSDQSFGEWIKASKVRTKLFVEADQGYDVDSADELFSLWKERKGIATKTANAEKKVRQQAVKQASTGGTRGSNAPRSAKIYRRSDIINLMQKDPERYEARADEFLKAYAEGRVK